MMSLRQKYIVAQGFCASVSIGALALLFYFCSHSFTDIVGISAKNLNALYLSGELRSLLWAERTALSDHFHRKGSHDAFVAAADKVSSVARAVADRAPDAVRPEILEFIRIHDEMRANVEHPAKTNGVLRPQTISARDEEYYNREYRQLGAFSEAVLLGSEEEQAETIRRTRLVMTASLVGAIGITALILLFSFLYLRKYVINPIVSISSASLAVARGEYRPIPVAGSGDEISVLAENFNHMIGEVRRASDELSEFNRTLEAKVEERTAQLADAEGKLLTAAKMSALGEMAGGVAHEINTPLGTIAIVADQLRELVEEDPIDRPAVSKMSETITQTVRRISTIIKGLRTFSRDGNRDPFERTPVRQIVDDTVLLCGEKFKHRSVELLVDPIASDLTIRCRSVQISQVLLNLISNACDAIQSNPERWIRVSAERRGDVVRICVTDSGKGISDQIRTKLFQPFFTTKEIGKGTGLGLSISKGIVSAHGGTLDLDSGSENTRFVIELPIEAEGTLPSPKSA